VSRRLLVALVAALSFVLLGSASAWAAPTPAPVPTLSPGQGLAPRTWRCESTGTTTTTNNVTGSTATRTDAQDCAVTSWATTPALVQLVVGVNSMPTTDVRLVSPSPLPVREVDPRVTNGALSAESADDLRRLAEYVPGAGAVIVLLLAVGVPLWMVRR
jgi:hypothetical protein